MNQFRDDNDIKGQKGLLSKLQDIEYDALVHISNICKKNQLRFYLRGGSVLGAVKYQGFVPWDDDIDIALPREDYLELIRIMPENFGGCYQFVSYHKTERAHCYFPRVILDKKACMEMGLPQNNERGLSLIDILPLDGMPNGKFARGIHIYKAYVYRVLASLWTLDVKETVSMHDGKKQKLLKLFHALGVHKLYEQDSIYRHLDKMYAKYPFGKTMYSGMIASSKLKKEIVRSEWWGDGTIMRFNELCVKVPENYDAYLKQLFGENYAEFEPPVEKRTKSHLTGNIKQ